MPTEEHAAMAALIDWRFESERRLERNEMEIGRLYQEINDLRRQIRQPKNRRLTALVRRAFTPPQGGVG